jgi:cell fate (sporulation/competence/biofilm development) regulator YlbF (YheA/YmcA/DUF963 family)
MPPTTVIAGVEGAMVRAETSALARARVSLGERATALRTWAAANPKKAAALLAGTATVTGVAAEAGLTADEATALSEMLAEAAKLESEFKTADPTSAETAQKIKRFNELQDKLSKMGLTGKAASAAIHATETARPPSGDLIHQAEVVLEAQEKLAELFGIPISSVPDVLERLFAAPRDEASLNLMRANARRRGRGFMG